mgnify:CR=1 FL=1
MSKIIGKIFCFINYHNWTWKLKQGDSISLDINVNPPKEATCSRCGERYE